MRAIIPCAGYGTRMNMPADKSKELLLNPLTRVPIINNAIFLCEQANITPLVVTRKDKQDLIEYCKRRNVETMIIQPEGEWPATILDSRDRWQENNLLILPDTRFTPDLATLINMKRDLEQGANYSVALHRVEDPTKWCVVQDYFITEKPVASTATMAMGLIAWKQEHGYDLFHSLSMRDVPFKLNNASFQYLNRFKDLTRTGIVESY